MPTFAPRSGQRIRRLMAQLGLVFLFALPPAFAANELPDLGDPTTTAISRAQEKNLGRQFMLKARQRMHYVDDPELADYIQTLGHRLLAASDAPSEPIRFLLAADPELNAFAVPGAYITVNTGLVMATRSENELAAVISHEIAHISQRHLARMIARSKQQSIPATAAMIAAILLGGQAGAAALTATSAAMLEDQLKYSRDFEREADARGIHTLAAAGYNPHAMVTFFGRLQRATRLQDSSAPEFLRTHPLTTSRIAEAEARAKDYPMPARLRDEGAFRRARAKISATLSDNTTQTVTEFADRLRDGRYADQGVARYGYALALDRVANYADARRQIDTVVQNAPMVAAYQAAQARIDLDSGAYDQALRRFRQVTIQHPDYAPGYDYYAEALLRTGHADQARPLLRAQIRRDPNDAILYQMLARTEGELGHQAESYQALAEYYYLNDNLEQAIRQLDIASQYAKGNTYLSQSIAARLEHIRGKLKNLNGRG